MKSAAELREIVHRATHYDQTHGDLSALTFLHYGCCVDEEFEVGISYRDIAEAFAVLADKRALEESIDD